MMEFRNNPRWDEGHVQVMDVLRVWPEGAFITQRQIADKCPLLGPLKMYEYWANSEKWYETTTRNIRHFVNELRRGRIHVGVDKRGRKTYKYFNPCVPIISEQGEHGGYRLPVDMRQAVKWWKGPSHGRSYWHALAEGYNLTVKKMDKTIAGYEKILGDNGDDLFDT